MKVKFIIFIALVIIVIGGIGFFANSKSSVSPSNLDGFAECISTSGAKFYGTFWCSHCQSQKKMFGSASKYLPYIECSTSDGLSQNQTCNDSKIESYPTWEFADGSRLTGELSLETLSEKTQCPLPQ